MKINFCFLTTWVGVNRFRIWLLLFGAVAPLVVCAQTVPGKPVVPALLYADQMPTLPGGGGNAALVAALQKKLKYPKPTSANPVEGRVVVSITVEADGSIRETKMVKSPRPDCESAVAAAVLQLPRFVPGRHNNVPVPVVVTVPLSFMIDPVAPASAIANTQP